MARRHGPDASLLRRCQILCEYLHVSVSQLQSYTVSSYRPHNYLPRKLPSRNWIVLDAAYNLLVPLTQAHET